jgi:hypothetical protein
MHSGWRDRQEGLARACMLPGVPGRVQVTYSLQTSAHTSFLVTPTSGTIHGQVRSPFASRILLGTARRERSCAWLLAKPFPAACLPQSSADIVVRWSLPPELLEPPPPPKKKERDPVTGE